MIELVQQKWLCTYSVKRSKTTKIDQKQQQLIEYKKSKNDRNT